MKFLFAILLFSLPFILLAQKNISENDIQTLVSFMSGEFNSKKQASADSAFFDITLHMTPILPDNNNGKWLYVEQAVSSGLDKPYRQRVYHVYVYDETTIMSKVYEIENPADFINAWKLNSAIEKLSPDMLVDRQGCGILLHKIKKGRFEGQTVGKECLSSLRGATYATSEVVIDKKKLVSWDRGWDLNDSQVWGAEKGGYIFVKKR